MKRSYCYAYRAGKVRKNTPVVRTTSRKGLQGRAKKRLQYNIRFLSFNISLGQNHRKFYKNNDKTHKICEDIPYNFYLN